MTNTKKLCGVCGAGLMYWEDRGYAHGTPQDHPAVPVDPGEVVAHPICDFCSVRVPISEVWTFPAGDTIVQTVGIVQATDAEPWAACEPCKDDIVERRLDRLAERALTNMSAENPEYLEMAEFVTAKLKQHWRAFLASNPGEPYKGYPVEYSRG